ncbi:anhydro-N-acetylmuramic acid kinase [Aliikangiella sp. IMCC44632]
MSAKTLSKMPSHDTSSEVYIGLMCGTSIDGVDVAVVDFSDNGCQLIAAHLHPIDKQVKSKLRSLCSLTCQENNLQSFEHRIELLGELDHVMGKVFAAAVNATLQRYSIAAASIKAIGSHGQTIRHQPSLASPFTLQIGDPNVIAYQTKITTVSDFRRMDMAAGGQGAPLAPAFHNAVLRSPLENRIILNLGGIANITYLPQQPEAEVFGFDTGTANTLMDVWFLHHHPNATDDFDRDANFAQQGNVNSALLARLMSDPYFQLHYPKSTGREYFSLEWLQQHIAALGDQLTPADVQATLLEFTAQSIFESVNKLQLPDYKVYSCGGGSHNPHLISQLETKFGHEILTTKTIGADPDYLEAITFAWLAKQRMEHKPGNLPSVTGARSAQILGAIYQCSA